MDIQIMDSFLVVLWLLGKLNSTLDKGYYNLRFEKKIHLILYFSNYFSFFLETSAEIKFISCKNFIFDIFILNRQCMYRIMKTTPVVFKKFCLFLFSFDWQQKTLNSPSGQCEGIAFRYYSVVYAVYNN